MERWFLQSSYVISQDGHFCDKAINLLNDVLCS
jgi:hypothetical protein